MITVLTGENAYKLRAELNRLVDIFVLEYTDMAVTKLDGSEAEYDRIREALENLPFLAARSLVVLYSPSASREFLDNYERLLSNTPETTDVIIVEPRLDKRSSYYKYLLKNTDFHEYKQIEESETVKWLMNTANNAGGKLDSRTAHMLVERVGLNQQLLANELDKLLAYNPQITVDTVELLTEASPQSTIFQLIDAAMAGDQKRTLELYKLQRAAKVEPQQIIAMLAWQLHVLALVKTAEGRSDQDIAAAAKLNPFVVRKSRPQAARLGVGQIRQLIHDLLAIDIGGKTSMLDVDDAVQLYLLRLKP